MINEKGKGKRDIYQILQVINDIQYITLVSSPHI